MSQSSEQVNLTVHRFAVLTCLVELLPITVGALVTTLKAGMAFADWPTSDGQNMLLYPWLQDLRHTDKFVEHGHRLAGILIGLMSIGLVTVTFLKESKSWVRVMAISVLLAVIGQGMLGGMRVLMDEQILAMTHSITGGLFFTLTFLFAALTRPAPESAGSRNESSLSFNGGVLTVVLPCLVLGQYVMGGMFRHLGRMLHEHVAGAILVSLVVIVVAWVLWRSERPDLKRSGRWILAALLIQVGLGLGSWVTKLGLPSMGWVASANSPAQNVVCTLHTVGGMFLLAATTTAATRVIMLARRRQLDCLRSVVSIPTPSSQQGGVA